MRSDREVQVLSSALSEIPSGEPITDIEFTEQDLNELQPPQDGSSDDGVHLRRFFIDAGYQICSSCGKREDVCSCIKSDYKSVYHLDPEYIVKKWCEEIKKLEHYENLYIKKSDPPIWLVEVVSHEFGILSFFVVSQSDRIVDVSPNLHEREFVVSLVEAGEIGKREHCYMWYNLRTEEHHTELHTAIRDAFSPLSEGICDLGSGIAGDSRNSISNNLRKYLSEKGFERVDPQRGVGQIGRIIDFADIEFAGQNEHGETILICRCENSANDIHIHYVKDGEIQPVEDCEAAESAAKRMRKKIDWRETLDQRTRNITGRTKALALAATTVSIGPVAVALAGLGGLELMNLDRYPYIPEVVISALLILLFTAIILPSVQISLFSWDIRGSLSRCRDWIPLM